ncbi:double-stranded RNA-binding protein 1-like isoform X1 [Lycium barbarum]|uniref:double-stranded RNA-binding protein 1-like isoform X1 n=1 Tax=Lycium barbarum TaxID=112863 RepID=UPI00293F6FC5|nr:double-stranded RNA-binding protein 1-like isoform X1 [Lycium barbarum]
MAQVSSGTQSSVVQSNEMAETVPNQNPLPNIPQNEAEKGGQKNIQEENMHKNRLQEFTQRSSLDRPVYHTHNLGTQHAPLFRSSVLVDGFWYTSPGAYSHLKAAEQEAAKVALISAKEKEKEKMKHDGCPLVREDTVFCKSIMNEYAVKMNLEKPTYQTVQSVAMLPVFKSTAVFNGACYTGETGKNKKEAEQLAARAAVLSILETDSDTVMLEIIKSKRKLYAVLGKVQDTGDVNAGVMPTELVHPVHVDKRKEAEIIEGSGERTNTGLLAYSLGQPSDVQAPNQLHVFKKPKSASSPVEVAPPLVFVAPVLDPSLVCSTSRKKRRNKKKAKKDVQADPQVPGGMLPVDQVPPCSMEQVPGAMLPVDQVPPCSMEQ